MEGKQVGMTMGLKRVNKEKKHTKVFKSDFISLIDKNSTRTCFPPVPPPSFDKITITQKRKKYT